MAKPSSRKPQRAGRVSSVADSGRRKAPATTAAFTWRHLKLRVVHTRNYINQGWSHLELRVISPKAAPCPVTATGYLSHFLDEDQLLAAGGPVAFFTAWLDREASSKAWAKAEFRWRQGDLFDRR